MGVCWFLTRNLRLPFYYYDSLHEFALLLYLILFLFPVTSKVCTAWKMNFSIMDFFSKCDQISSFRRIWSYLLKKILNGKLHFLCNDWSTGDTKSVWKVSAFYPMICKLFYRGNTTCELSYIMCQGEWVTAKPLWW